MKSFLFLIFCLILVGCNQSDNGRIDASGTIEGTEVNVGSEVAGRVIEIRVDEGSPVQTGDTLALIDNTEYLLQLRQAEANLASFESQYRLAVAGSRKEDIAQAEAQLQSAEADFNRIKELMASQAATQKQYDDANARYISARETYEKVKSGLRPEEITSARVKREQAAAQVDLLRKKVRDCFVTSPSNGTITLRSMEPGELATVGMNLFRITKLDNVKLTIYVPEAQLGKVHLGQSASLSIDAHPEKSYTGKVTYISPVAEFTPKNVQTKEERAKLVFAVKLEVENPHGDLKPGLPADATILTEQVTSK